MTDARTEMMAIVELIRPYALDDMPLVRVGNEFDGGYVMGAVVLEATELLSIGIGWDVSFDLALAERGARVLQFDHTLEPGYVPGGVVNEHFVLERLGLGPRTDGDLLSFADMVARLDQSDGARHALNFDIEGAEYEAFAGLDPAVLASFETIACELHDWGRLVEPEFRAEVRRFLSLLAAGHVPVHLHPNNNQGGCTVAGVTLPEVIEITYVRRDLDTFSRLSTDPLPGPLDNPNNPYLPDFAITLP